MPIDPRLAALGNPVQGVNYAQVQGQALELGRMRDEANQRIQAAKDDAAGRAALQQTGGDYEAAAKLLDSNGVPQIAAALRDRLMKQREAIQKITTSHLENYKRSTDLAGSIYNTVQPGDEVGLAAANRAVIGLFDDGPERQQMQALLPQNASAEELARAKGMAQTVSQHFDESKKAADEVFTGNHEAGLARSFSLATTPEQWQGVQHLASQYQLPKALIASFGQFSPEAVQLAKTRILTPEQMTTQSGVLPTGEKTVQAKTAEAAQANIAADNARADAALKVQQGHLAVDIAKEKREGAAQSGASAIVLKPGTADYRQARDLADGTLTFQDFQRLHSRAQADAPLRAAIYDTARTLNPNFNPAAFEIGFKFASNPKIKQQMASLKNVESGVDDLLKFSDRAERSGIPLLNKAVQLGGVTLGGKSYTNFQTAVTAFADELSGALGYGSATDMSREMGFKMTDLSQSPASFRSNVQDVIIPFIARKKASILGEMGPYAPGGSANPGGSGGAEAGYTRMKKPDGTEIDVPNAKVEDAKKLGAVIK